MLIINANADKFVVAQSNELMEATYSPALTARAHKIARLIFSLISPDDKDLKLYTITIDALKQYLGYRTEVTWGRFHEDLKDIADKLNKEPIVIKSENNILTAYLIAGYIIDFKNSTVTFEIPLILKPFLLELKRNFTRYPLLYIPKLRSSYSIRMYELLYQYKTIGHRICEVDALQRMVGSEYALYADFKRKVILIAQRDLAEHTDICFEFEEVKSGRRVSAIKFFIHTNSMDTLTATTIQATQLDFLENNIEVSEKFTAFLRKQLINIGFQEVQIQKFEQIGFQIVVSEHQRQVAQSRCGTAEKYYGEKLALLQKCAEQAGTEGGAKLNNPTGFYVRALQEDWLDGQMAQQKQVQTVENNLKKARRDGVRQLERLEARRNEWKRLWENEKIKITEGLFLNLEILENTFAEAKKNVDISFQDIVFPPELSPRAAFDKGGMSRNLMLSRLETNYSARFEAVNKRFSYEINELEKEIKALKAQFKL